MIFVRIRLKCVSFHLLGSLRCPLPHLSPEHRRGLGLLIFTSLNTFYAIAFKMFIAFNMKETLSNPKEDN